MIMVLAAFLNTASDSEAASSTLFLFSSLMAKVRKFYSFHVHNQVMRNGATDATSIAPNLLGEGF